MESLDSDALDRIRLDRDAHRKPLFAFVDVLPGAAFLQSGDVSGNCLYRLTGLDFGGPVPVTTISSDAVMIVGRGFRSAHAKGGPAAADVVASAIDAAHAEILTAMKAPSDWRPPAGSCH